MGEFGAAGEERITMRNINTAFQRTVDRKSPRKNERDESTASDNISERDGSRALGAIGAVNSNTAFERDCDLEANDSLRNRKRKQGNNSEQIVSSECAPSNQPSLSEQGVHAGRLRENKQTPAREIQDSGLSDIARGRKRRRETGKVHEVGLDISLRTDGSHRLQGLGFDISVSSSVAVGIKHATCSILPDKDTDKAMGTRLAVDVNNKNAGIRKRDERAAGYCEVPIGTTVEASEIPSKDLCSTSATVTSGRRSLEDLVRATLISDDNNHEKADGFVANLEQSPPRLEKFCPDNQVEDQKLQVTEAALHSQLKILNDLAEKGSKDCKQCQSVKEGISDLLSTYYGHFTAQKSARPAATSEQRSSSEEGLLHNSPCNSPVASSTIERTELEKEDCNRDLQEAADMENADSSLQSEMDIPKQKEGLPARTEVNENIQEMSDTECHLCIELGSLQSDDPDSEPGQYGPGREECTLTPLVNDVRYNSERLDTCPEENQTESFHLSRFGEANFELEKDTNSCIGIENENKGEESSAKSSKGEGCWNSGIARNAGDLYGGQIDDQAERDGYIDLRCGCTSQKYGDTFGILRLYQNGKLEIQCQCSIGCIEGKRMAPATFERHGGRGASKKWRDTIWIVLGDQKVQFSKVKGLDAFVRRYKDTTNRTTTRQPSQLKQSTHRDEFLHCKKCLKRRRFHQKTKEECRLFHEASMNPEWECSDHPLESSRSCQDEEEREARQAYRGCVRSRTCPGCIECVCVGCFNCRFEDCECRLCSEFIANNK